MQLSFPAAIFVLLCLLCMLTYNISIALHKILRVLIYRQGQQYPEDQQNFLGFIK